MTDKINVKKSKDLDAAAVEINGAAGTSDATEQ